MSYIIKEIYYKGFKIIKERATSGGDFYTIKGDVAMSKIYLCSEKAAMNVIDTFLRSVHRNQL